MSATGLVALVDRLRSLPTEVEWVEFKRNRHEPQELGEYLSALANAACLANQPHGYLLFGVDDTTHAVVGTGFDPYAAKGKGNQDLLPWLGAGLRPNSGFELHVVAHPDGRVVLFEVGPAGKGKGWSWLHDEVVRRHQPVDVVRPEPQHLLPLLRILGPVVDAPHPADRVVQRFLHHIGRPTLLVQQRRGRSAQVVDGERRDFLILQRDLESAVECVVGKGLGQRAAAGVVPTRCCRREPSAP